MVVVAAAAAAPLLLLLLVCCSYISGLSDMLNLSIAFIYNART
jgi:hypothetical protein